MKIFKTTDIALSILLILGSLIIAGTHSDYTFYGYFITGGWQVVSMLVHEYHHWFTERGGRRRVYHKIVIACFVLALTGWLVYYVLYAELVILLFTAPVMAIYYTALCWRETFMKMKRPLYQLK